MDKQRSNSTGPAAVH